MPVKDFTLLVVYLLVPLAWNFTQRLTPCQIIYKVFDHKSRYLFCQTHFSSCLWLVNITNLLSNQYVQFALNGDWKKPFASKLEICLKDGKKKILKANIMM